MVAAIILLLFFTSGYTLERKTILSFGGNGNIGSAVLHRLISKAKERGKHIPDIILVSRGTWHFDNADRIRPHVHNVVCDRAFEPKCDDVKPPTTNATGSCDINSLRHCKDLMKIVNDTKKFDVVLDFSAYEAKWVHDAAEILKHKEVGVYIYISSDSVYEVSEPKTALRPSVEDDAIRPKDPTMRKKLKNEDRYGDAKLGGEEALRHRREQENGFPWVALRLADVFGPRDTTTRWQLYQMWVRFYQDFGVPPNVPSAVGDVTESFTFVEDVAQAVDLVVTAGPSAWNQAYNIAAEDTVTLTSILLQMAKLQQVPLRQEDFGRDDFYLYPTVFTGPMSIEKAKAKLGFAPTHLDEAFRQTIDWYKARFAQSTVEREEIISRLLHHAVPAKKRDQLYLAVDRELSKAGVTVNQYRKKRKGELEELFDDKQDMVEGAKRAKEEL